MEFMPYYVPTNCCCLIVSKTKNEMAILHHEIERLSCLEEECNKKLDEFYASKQEFEFMLRNLVDKILGTEAESYPIEKEIIDEFSNFLKAVWQTGADKLVKLQKKIQYTSLVDGLPLSIYIQALQNTIEKGSMSIAQTICHPYCTSLFYSMYTEITGELFERLSTGDICFRQYEYLKKSLIFLSKLKEFIKTYIEKGNIHSIKIFSDEIISGISLKVLGDGNYDDKENLGAFREVVNLLTGQLLGYESPFDPHSSEIIPVVGDILHPRPGKRTIVNRLVNFFLKGEIEDANNFCDKDSYENKDTIEKYDSNLNNSYSATLLGNDCLDQMFDQTSAYLNTSDSVVEVNGTYYQICDNSGALYQTASSSYGPFQPCFQTSFLNQTLQSAYLPPLEVSNFIPNYYELQRKPNKYSGTGSRRGRKPANSSQDTSMNINCDLKPIKIPKLKLDLIKPLT